VAELISSFRRKYGISRADPRGTLLYSDKRTAQASDEQLTLF
jgi:hypothetical protein